MGKNRSPRESPRKHDKGWKRKDSSESGTLSSDTRYKFEDILQNQPRVLLERIPRKCSLISKNSNANISSSSKTKDVSPKEPKKIPPSKLVLETSQPSQKKLKVHFPKVDNPRPSTSKCKDTTQSKCLQKSSLTSSFLSTEGSIDEEFSKHSFGKSRFSVNLKNKGCTRDPKRLTPCSDTCCIQFSNENDSERKKMKKKDRESSSSKRISKSQPTFHTSMKMKSQSSQKSMDSLLKRKKLKDDKLKRREDNIKSSTYSSSQENNKVSQNSSKCVAVFTKKKNLTPSQLSPSELNFKIEKFENSSNLLKNRGMKKIEYFPSAPVGDVYKSETRISHPKVVAKKPQTQMLEAATFPKTSGPNIDNTFNKSKVLYTQSNDISYKSPLIYQESEVKSSQYRIETFQKTKETTIYSQTSLPRQNEISNVNYQGNDFLLGNNEFENGDSNNEFEDRFRDLPLERTPGNGTNLTEMRLDETISNFDSNNTQHSINNGFHLAKEEPIFESPLPYSDYHYKETSLPNIERREFLYDDDDDVNDDYLSNELPMADFQKVMDIIESNINTSNLENNQLPNFSQKKNIKITKLETIPSNCIQILPRTKPVIKADNSSQNDESVANGEFEQKKVAVINIQNLGQLRKEETESQESGYDYNMIGEELISDYILPTTQDENAILNSSIVDPDNDLTNLSYDGFLQGEIVNNEKINSHPNGHLSNSLDTKKSFSIESPPLPEVMQLFDPSGRSCVIPVPIPVNNNISEFNEFINETKCINEIATTSFTQTNVKDNLTVDLNKSFCDFKEPGQSSVNSNNDKVANDSDDTNCHRKRRWVDEKRKCSSEPFKKIKLRRRKWCKTYIEGDDLTDTSSEVSSSCLSSFNDNDTSGFPGGLEMCNTSDINVNETCQTVIDPTESITIDDVKIEINHNVETNLKNGPNFENEKNIVNETNLENVPKFKNAPKVENVQKFGNMPKLENVQKFENAPKLENVQKFGNMPKLENVQKFGNSSKLKNVQKFGNMPKLENVQKFGNVPKLENEKSREIENRIKTDVVVESQVDPEPQPEPEQEDSDIELRKIKEKTELSHSKKKNDNKEIIIKKKKSRKSKFARDSYSSDSSSDDEYGGKENSSSDDERDIEDKCGLLKRRFQEDLSHIEAEMNENNKDHEFKTPSSPNRDVDKEDDVLSVCASPSLMDLSRCTTPLPNLTTTQSDSSNIDEFYWDTFQRKNKDEFACDLRSYLEKNQTEKKINKIVIEKNDFKQTDLFTTPVRNISTRIGAPSTSNVNARINNRAKIEAPTSNAVRVNTVRNRIEAPSANNIRSSNIKTSIEASSSSTGVTSSTIKTSIEARVSNTNATTSTVGTRKTRFSSEAPSTINTIGTNIKLPVTSNANLNNVTSDIETSTLNANVNKAVTQNEVSSTLNNNAVIRAERPVFNKIFLGVCYTYFVNGYCTRAQCIFEHKIPDRLLKFQNVTEETVYGIMCDAVKQNYKFYLKQAYLCVIQKFSWNYALQHYRSMFLLNIFDNTLFENTIVLMLQKCSSFPTVIANLTEPIPVGHLFLNTLLNYINQHSPSNKYWDSMKPLLWKVGFTIEMLCRILNECTNDSENTDRMNDVYSSFISTKYNLQVPQNLWIGFCNLLTVRLGHTTTEKEKVADEKIDDRVNVTNNGIASPDTNFHGPASVDENPVELNPQNDVNLNNNYSVSLLEDLRPPRSVYREKDTVWKFHDRLESLRKGLNHNDYKHVVSIIKHYANGDKSAFTRHCHRALVEEINKSQIHIDNIVKIAVQSGELSTMREILSQLGTNVLIELADRGLWVYANELLMTLQKHELYNNNAGFTLLAAEIYLANHLLLEALWLLKQSDIIFTNRKKWKVQSKEEDINFRTSVVTLLLEALCQDNAEKAFFLFDLILGEQNSNSSPINLTRIVDRLMLSLLSQDQMDSVVNLSKKAMRYHLNFHETTFRTVIRSLVPFDIDLARQFFQYATCLGVYSTINAFPITCMVINIDWSEEEMYLILSEFLQKLALDVGFAISHVGTRQLSVSFVLEAMPTRKDLLNNISERTNENMKKVNKCKALLKNILETRFDPPITIVKKEQGKICKINGKSLVEYLKTGHFNN